MTTKTAKADLAYASKKQEIRRLIEKLEAKVDAHLKPGQEAHWGHVGDLGHITETLNYLLDPK